jgi:hypothetical protein
VSCAQSTLCWINRKPRILRIGGDALRSKPKKHNPESHMVGQRMGDGE